MLTLSSLRHTQHKLRPKYVGTMDEILALRWLETEHAIVHERALHQVAFGLSQDLGVHGFHLDQARETLILFVCNSTKYVSDFAGPLNRFCTHGLAALFTDRKDLIDSLFDPQEPIKGSQRFVSQFQSLVDESKSLIRVVNIRLVFFGQPESASTATIIGNFQEDIRHQRRLIDLRFPGQVVEVTSTVKSADGSSTVPDKLKGYRRQIAMANHVETSGPDGQLMQIGTVSLWQLLEIYRDLGIRFLSRNVRASLTVSTGSNQALSKAFREVADGTSPPEFFLFRHNGVTLTASACQLMEGGLDLYEPQLLNGAQTVTTLVSVCADLTKRKEMTREVEKRLKKLFVIGRVISNATRSFVTSVAIASNRQNPIMPWHLRAHDDVQSLLQSWFLDRLGLYYEVQEKAFDTMSEDERQALGVLEGDKCIDIRKLAQTFLAADGLIDKMQQMKAVFEDDDFYAKTFHQVRTQCAPEDVVFCYKIERRIRKMLTLLGGSDKYSFVKSARSLIWSLLSQAYLNSNGREKLGATHGRSLVATGGFTEVVEGLASTRVKPLLVWIANHSEYVDQVKAERYGFLGTRKVFDQSMGIARDKWGWQHKHLGSSK